MAMNNQLLAVVQHIEAERGVSREIVLTAIEQALKQAAEKNPGFTKDLRVAIDRKDYSLHVYDTLVVSDANVGPGFIGTKLAMRFNHGNALAEGETLEVEIPASKLGRIAASTSRQMIMQKIREAERTNTISEYKDREGDIVSGTVSAVVHRDTYVTVGKTEMIMPAKERIPTESYQVGDPIRAIIKKVDPDAKGPSVTLSRADPLFVEALFRLEVSEIADGVVEILECSRDPGYRAKIAVRTSNESVDPVGACVGQKGSRVRTIMNELNGEKIDIVRWNEDPRVFVTAALSPAKIESIEVLSDLDKDGRRQMEVVVSPEEYTQTLGKRGMNVKLTQKLTGWHLEVKKSMATASFEEQKKEAVRALMDILSVAETVAEQLADSGYLTVEGIAADDEASFLAATGLDEVAGKGIYAAASAVAELTAKPEADAE